MSIISIRYNGLATQLISDVRVFNGFKRVPKENMSHAPAFKALWDTGATNTIISPHVVDKLNLPMLSNLVITGINGSTPTGKYLTDLWLSENFVVRRVEVFKANLIRGVDVLIGMDIITRGNFSISNVNGKTLFNFEEPEIFA